MNTEQQELDFLDVLALTNAIVTFAHFDDMTKNTKHVQDHLDEIDKKLNIIMEALGIKI